MNPQKRYIVDYVNRCLNEDFYNALANFGMEQLVDFVTWSRLVNNVLNVQFCPTYMPQIAPP